MTDSSGITLKDKDKPDAVSLTFTSTSASEKRPMMMVMMIVMMIMMMMILTMLMMMMMMLCTRSRNEVKQTFSKAHSTLRQETRTKMQISEFIILQLNLQHLVCLYL